MQITVVFLTVALSLSKVAFSAENEPCYGPDGAAGVCVADSDCTSAGGTSISGACPADPSDIKCCSKPTCGSASGANCRWTSDCAGDSITNECPGPSQMQCCQSAEDGFGGYDEPSLPDVGACKQVSVDGAQKIVEAFPGSVREIGCTRDCACPGDSDHCCGLATDMMCSDDGGLATLSGKEMAEWVMKNRAELDLKYVIWGQRIWIADTHDEKDWGEWEPMEDREDLTQNHWDHVHVSYNG